MGLVEVEAVVDCCCFPLLTGFVLGFMSKSFNILDSKSSAAVAEVVADAVAAGLESAGEDDILVVVFELLAKIGVGFNPNRSPKGSAPEVAALKFSAEELVFIIVGGLGFKKSGPPPPEISSKQSILLLLLVTCLAVAGWRGIFNLKKKLSFRPRHAS